MSAPASPRRRTTPSRSRRRSTAHAEVEAALKAFEAERIGIGRRIIERARHLGAYMRTRFATPEERALAERHHGPQAVMSETALLDFLRA